MNSTYFTDVKAELKNIRWPSREQALLYTALVVVISLITAAYLGALDYVFSKSLAYLITQF